MTVLLAAIALLVGGFALASCGGDDNGEASATTATETTDTTTTESTTTTTTEPEVEKPTVVRIVVVNGAPEGGIVRKSVDKGARVVLVVTSDVADEVHHTDTTSLVTSRRAGRSESRSAPSCPGASRWSSKAAGSRSGT